VTYAWKRVPLIVAPFFQADQFNVLLRFLIEKRPDPVLIFELAVKSSVQKSISYRMTRSWHILKDVKMYHGKYINRGTNVGGML
jgi:hypothetical protein